MTRWHRHEGSSGLLAKGVFRRGWSPGPAALGRNSVGQRALGQPLAGLLDLAPGCVPTWCTHTPRPTVSACAAAAPQQALLHSPGSASTLRQDGPAAFSQPPWPCLLRVDHTPLFLPRRPTFLGEPSCLHPARHRGSSTCVPQSRECRL